MPYEKTGINKGEKEYTVHYLRYFPDLRKKIYNNESIIIFVISYTYFFLLLIHCANSQLLYKSIQFLYRLIISLEIIFRTI